MTSIELLRLPQLSAMEPMRLHTSTPASHNRNSLASSGCGSSDVHTFDELPCLDSADWPGMDLQDLLRLGDADLMLPFPLDDETLHISMSPPALLPPPPQLESPERGSGASSRSVTPQLHPVQVLGTVDGHNAPVEQQCAASEPDGSGVGSCSAAAGASAFGDGGAKPRPSGRVTRGGRRRRNAAPAVVDPPKQLQEFEKKHAVKREQDRRNQESCRARKRQRREEGFARIAHLRSQIEWQEGVATGLAYANASLQQRLAPPHSARAAEGVQLGLAAPETVTCIAASLTVHGFTAAAGLALQSSCSAADLQSICKAVAGCLRRLLAHGPAIGLVSLLGAMQKVLETVWEAQPALWQSMVGATATASATSAADTKALLGQLQLNTAQRATLAVALQDRQTAMDLVARRRAVVAAELQAAAAAGDSVVGHILLVQTASKADDHAGCIAAQALAADREFVHAVCFGALGASQAAIVMAAMWESGIDMPALCRAAT